MENTRKRKLTGLPESQNPNGIDLQKKREFMHTVLDTIVGLIPPLVSLIEEYFEWPIVYGVGCWGLFMSANKKERQWCKCHRSCKGCHLRQWCKCHRSCKGCHLDFDHDDLMKTEFSHGQPFSLDEFIGCFKYLTFYGSSMFAEDIHGILETPIFPPISVNFEFHLEESKASTYKDLFKIIGHESAMIYGIKDDSGIKIPVVPGHLPDVDLIAREVDGIFHFLLA